MPNTYIPLRAGVEHEFTVESNELAEAVANGGEREKVLIKASEWVASLLEQISGLKDKTKVIQSKQILNAETYRTFWIFNPEHDLIDPEDEATQFDIELASPAVDFVNNEWIQHTEAIYAKLKEKGIKTSVPEDRCSTHIHVSLAAPQKDLAKDLGALKSVAKAIVYFERSIDAVVHRERVQSRRCKFSNFASAFYLSKLADPTNIEGILASIDGSKIAEEIVNRMCSEVKGSKVPSDYNPMSPDFDPTKQMPFKRLEQDRLTKYFRWNFLPLIEKEEEPRCTIEFRQPEGSGSAREAIGWRLFAVGFVQAAIVQGVDQAMTKKIPTMQNLKDFVEQGVKLARSGDVKRLETVFAGKVDLPPSTIKFFEDGYKWYQITREGDGSGSESTIYYGEPDR